MSETIPEYTNTGHKLYFSSVSFSGFQVNSISSFVLASFLITLLCWSERFLSYFYHKNSKYNRNQKRFRSIVVKTLLYGILVTLRLSYMLLIMSMNSQIFVIVVTGLTTGQLIIEYIRSIPTYQEYVIHPLSDITIKDNIQSPNCLENSALMGNIESYRDEIELESRNFVSENTNNEASENIKSIT